MITFVLSLKKAKKKPCTKKSPADLGVQIETLNEIVEVTEPPARQAGVIVDDVETLVNKLRDAGRIAA